ncbi:GIY-YIG nuclease family protein [Shewanella oncorhynchi]|uniref:GIY-YIG nuclease family protein n=1 Tax=Shewanella oncorhynchi TaxID=2726434 RepID=UPI003D7B8BD1
MPSNAFLTIGKAADGELIGIDAVKRGKSDLTCPFCQVPLIAAKGNFKVHHFRHDGETCHQSLQGLPQIPGWDHFHLLMPDFIVNVLQNYAEKHPGEVFWYEPKHVRELLKHNLIDTDSYTGKYRLTDAALIITGQLSLSKFATWFRNELKSRIKWKTRLVDNEDAHRAYLEIEAWRQQQLMMATTYLFELTHNNGEVFYKVGRTRREVDVRLAEVKSEMKAHFNRDISAKILRLIPNGGFLEQYVLYRYRLSKREIGKHQEYLSLDASALKQLKAAFTRVANDLAPFDKDERFIATGRWRYEPKRLDAVRKGIRQTIQSGSSFGRPKGTIKVGGEEWRKQYQYVIDLLEAGNLSQEKIARMTFNSTSTVKRVKQVISKETPE